ncbi:MAG: hypothetical protein ACI8UZ_000764 [Akkermansiaceae bacterium]|jgi:hypothetical protein
MEEKQTPLFLTETGPLRARALDGAKCSALNVAIFIVDAEIADPSNLVITEIQLQPSGYRQWCDFLSS